MPCPLFGNFPHSVVFVARFGFFKKMGRVPQASQFYIEDMTRKSLCLNHLSVRIDDAIV